MMTAQTNSQFNNLLNSQAHTQTYTPTNTKTKPPSCWVIGEVVTVVTRYGALGDGFYVLIKRADNSKLGAKWPVESGHVPLMPAVGDTIRLCLRHEPTRDNNAQDVIQPNGYLQQHRQRHYYNIDQWQGVLAPYPLQLVEKLYRSCPQAALLDALWRVITAITVPVLQHWLFELMATPAIIVPFSQASASKQHHHSYPGGLLAHSVECAQWVSQVAATSLQAAEASLAVAAALLHDVGKIESYRPQGQQLLLAHEVLTLTRLEPYVVRLEQHWPQGAAGLRQMLSWSAPYDKFPRLPGTVLVKAADHYSTALSARQLAFQSQPDYRCWARLDSPHCQQTFNRIQSH